MGEYKVQITQTSREFTKIEQVRLTTDLDSKSIDMLTNESDLVITPTDYAVLLITNENSESKQYTKYVIFDNHGDTYVTGSESCWNAFLRIWNFMSDEPEDTWAVRFYKKDSKNYVGKKFLTATVFSKI